MAIAEVRSKDIARFRAIVPTLVDLPASRMWADYGAEADVLYVGFHRPQRATDSPWTYTFSIQDARTKADLSGKPYVRPNDSCVLGDVTSRSRSVSATTRRLAAES